MNFEIIQIMAKYSPYTFEQLHIIFILMGESFDATIDVADHAVRENMSMIDYLSFKGFFNEGGKKQ